MAQIDLAHELVHSVIGEAAHSVLPLAGGEVGRVFRADTSASSYLVKLVDCHAERSFAEEPVDDRVYGGRFSNLRPAYELLRGAGLPTPRLYGSGVEPNQGVCYAVFDYLEGDPDDFSEAWFCTVGASLRDVHAITRPYQGWVGMGAPLVESWPSAFSRALAINFEKARPVLGPSMACAVEERLRDTPSPDDSNEFVLSHTDGFQGILKRRKGAWELLGHIDVEDMQFTDRRFVLTGFELSHRLDGRTIPDTFWQAYGSRPAEHRVQFELLYLLVWARVVRDRAKPFAACLSELERAVAG